jgi:pimeloyl-ACP methyl ester carboxylesterase
MTETMIKVGADEVWSDDSGGSLPPLVLIHPGVGDSRIWDGLMPTLTSAYRVIRYDARGFGRSPAPSESFVLFDDLLTVLDHYGLDRVAVVGCSQGGDCAIALAVTQPARVSALVLLCPGITGYQLPDDPEFHTRLEAAEKEGLDAFADVILDFWGRAGRTDVVVEQARSAAKAWIANDEFEQSGPAVFDRLGEITVPTSLLVGDLDMAWLLDCNRQAALRIPGVTFIEVPGVDHFPPLRIPDQVLALIHETIPA